MNLALGTLFVFLLVIPGIAFRSTLYFGPRTKKQNRLSAFDDFIWAIIPGLGFQFFGALVINSMTSDGYRIDFIGFAKILYASGAPDEFENIETYLPEILLYNGCLIAIAALFGYLTRIVVQGFHLDHRYSFLRFNNEWYYILRGETIFFCQTTFKLPGDNNIKWWLRVPTRMARRHQAIKDIRAERKKFIPCEAYIVTKEIDTERYIFRGVVSAFHLQSDGQIDTIWLTTPRKCKLGDDDNEDNWKPISTDIIALKGCEIVDIGMKQLPMKSNTQKTDPTPGGTVNPPTSDNGIEELPPDGCRHYKFP